jgi:glycosidase
MDYQNRLVRFIENHDEPRSVMAFGQSKARAAAVITASLPGMRLFFHGQMDGRQIHLPIQIRRSRPEAADPGMQIFYQKLLDIVNMEVFHSGRWQLREIFPETEDNYENLVAFTWQFNDQLTLIIVNLSQHPAQGWLNFADTVQEDREYVLTEVFSGNTLSRAGRLLAHPGLAFHLTGYQAEIWRIDTV